MTPDDAASTDDLFVHLAAPLCEHDFKGWRNFEDGRGGEAVCSKCGMGAMEHTLRNDPTRTIDAVSYSATKGTARGGASSGSGTGAHSELGSSRPTSGGSGPMTDAEDAASLATMGPLLAGIADSTRPPPIFPPPAISTTAAVALAALREIKAVSFDRRAVEIAKRALGALGEWP